MLEGRQEPVLPAPQAASMPVASTIASPRGCVPRGTRLTSAVAHVGTPIIHSAVTTSGAALVLCFCEINFMVMVGTIVAVNASMGVLATFLVLGAMLAMCAPEDFAFLSSRWNWAMRACLIVVLLA